MRRSMEARAPVDSRLRLHQKLLRIYIKDRVEPDIGETLRSLELLFKISP